MHTDNDNSKREIHHALDMLRSSPDARTKLGIRDKELIDPSCLRAPPMLWVTKEIAKYGRDNKRGQRPENINERLSAMKGAIGLLRGNAQVCRDLHIRQHLLKRKTCGYLFRRAPKTPPQSTTNDN